MLFSIAQWFDTNYEKIWLIACIVAIVFVLLGTVSGSEAIYDIGDTVTDFYDEILSE